VTIKELAKGIKNNVLGLTESNPEIIGSQLSLMHRDLPVIDVNDTEYIDELVDNLVEYGLSITKGETYIRITDIDPSKIQKDE